MTKSTITISRHHDSPWQATYHNGTYGTSRYGDTPTKALEALFRDVPEAVGIQPTTDDTPLGIVGVEKNESGQDRWVSEPDSDAMDAEIERRVYEAMDVFYGSDQTLCDRCIEHAYCICPEGGGVENICYKCYEKQMVEEITAEVKAERESEPEHSPTFASFREGCDLDTVMGIAYLTVVMLMTVLAGGLIR